MLRLAPALCAAGSKPDIENGKAIAYQATLKKPE
jgi:hypothetical protein